MEYLSSFVHFLFQAGSFQKQICWKLPVPLVNLVFQDGGTNSSGTRTKKTTTSIDLGHVGNDLRCMNMDSQNFGPCSGFQKGIDKMCDSSLFFPFGFRGSGFDLYNSYWSCWEVLNVPPEMMGMWNFYVNFRNLIRYPPQSESDQTCHSPKWRHVRDQTLEKQLNQTPVSLIGAVCWTKWYKLLLN